VIVSSTSGVRFAPQVNVFVGAESIRDGGGLAMPITETCVIAIIPAVSGGCNA
jgi:molybdopterin converting factor small subunit